MNSKRILALLVVAVAATVGGFYAGHVFTGGETVAATQNNGNAVEQLWKAAPPGASGTAQPLASFKGKPVVVNFWASWCGPCVKEMPELSALHREYEKKGITFIGLGVDSEKNVNDFLGKVNVDYPVYVTGFGGADLARSFGNNAGGLPFTVVIDAKGVVRSTKLGEVNVAELKRTLDAL
ncbi:MULTISPECIES: TlpA disulfide reductase family protein [unclassified Caballeronia]|uniref:TlpA family protein disulfide reductase n=1 Tax=unclassified Caballeronia TaxID=2646786 RepID=UPI002029233A|nr:MULTISPECIES: TlpA disulfide reductase family protein [unclassified Caballeronia]MDR5772544.1 TlpA disulfide reductase family protein [Caballeronia sp. LZ002]MDR5847978.1 TlpA disulfide reductase family protein [Caballeronia sp. LZ003]